MTQSRTLPRLALVGVTAIWGVTFVQGVAGEPMVPPRASSFPAALAEPSPGLRANESPFGHLAHGPENGAKVQ